MTTILRLHVHDVRFPTSAALDGSDAMNPDPDYSAAYVVLETDVPGLEGHGLTFTIGRGNEVCCAAIHALAPLVVGRTLEGVAADMGGFWRHVTSDSQLEMDRPRQGREPSRDGCRGQRGVGPLGQERRQAGVAARGRHDARRDRAPGRLPLHHRLHHAAGGARAAARARAGPGRTPGRPAGARLSLLHDVGGLAGLRRRQAAAPRARGGRGRLRAREDEGRPRPRRRRAPAAHRARGAGARPPVDDRRQPGLGRRPGAGLGCRGWRSRGRGSSRSRPAPTTCWAIAASARPCTARWRSPPARCARTA